MNDKITLVLISSFIAFGIQFGFYLNDLMNIGFTGTDKKILWIFASTTYLCIEIFLFSIAIHSLKEYLCDNRT